MLVVSCIDIDHHLAHAHIISTHAYRVVTTFASVATDASCDDVVSVRTSMAEKSVVRVAMRKVRGVKTRHKR